MARPRPARDPARGARVAPAGAPRPDPRACLVDEAEQALSYRQLADAAAAFAAGLQQAGVQPRQCVAIMLPTSAEYFSTYLGVLQAGAIPVPIYPPARASQLEDHVLRHGGILDNAQAVLLVTVPEAMVVARLLQARVPGLRHVVTAQELAARGGAPTPVALRGDDIAFIQFTSGSTGNPKGVALTHANLLANIRAMEQAVQATPRDVFVSWLPLYHDMGLIGAWLGSLYVGYAAGGDVAAGLPGAARALAAGDPPLPRQPVGGAELRLRTVRQAHRRRGARRSGPELLAHRIQRRRGGQRRYGCALPAAFRALRPAPGHGHAGLRPGRGQPGPAVPAARSCGAVDRVQREAFAREHRALPAAATDDTALRFTACGAPLPGHAVHLVDDDGHEVGERVEGRLEFRGPSATQGYFRNPAQTARLFHDGWLDSGDRAYRAAVRLLHHRARQGHRHPPRPQPLPAGDRAGRRRCRRRAQGLRGRVRQPRPGHRHRAPGGAGRDATGRCGRRRRCATRCRARWSPPSASRRTSRSRAAAQRAEDLQRQGAALRLPRGLRGRPHRRGRAERAPAGAAAGGRRAGGPRATRVAAGASGCSAPLGVLFWLCWWSWPGR